MRPETLRGGGIIRHRHATPYVAIVLCGSYEEAGDAGRFRVGAGDVLVHGAYSAHCDVVGQAKTMVLNLAAPPDKILSPRGRASDPDLLAVIAERDPVAASIALAEMFEPVVAREADDVDDLAALLIANTDTRIGAWSEARRCARETLSRRFRRLYGIDAAQFRSEARARRAWRLIVGTTLSLADIAAASGHADQAHMTRAVKALTGAPPGAWRRVTKVQD